MVERESLERFRLANAELSRLVRAELEDFFRSLNLARPEAVRDALLEFLPILTAQYGDVAATLAADWYEESRAASGAAGRFRALTAPSVPTEAVEAKVRYLAGHLWTPEPAAILGGLLTAADKYVKQPGRDTTAYNAKREKVRWARVPSGKKTCAFCLMLAGRDVLYLTEKSAKYDKSGEKYHGDCDCAPTRIASIRDYPEGFDPDGMYEMYKEARKRSGSGDIKDIAESFRRLHPDAVTDGVHNH